MDGGLVMIVVICSLMPVVFIALYCLMWKCRSQNEWNEDDMKATSCSDSKEGDGRRPPEDDEEECRRFGVGWTNDFDFLVFHLHTISHRESLRYSLGVYLVFLSIFTYTLVAHSGLGNGSSFWATDAVIHRLESRWKSISREKMFWDFMTTGVDLESGGGGLLQLYNLSQQTVASYNHILPIIRVGQHRVKPVKCDNLDDLLQGNYHGWSTKCYPEYSRSNEDRITFGNATCKDRLNKNGFAWSDLSKVRFPGEEFLPWATLGGYVSDYPSQLGYFVDTYSESSSRDVLQFFNCLFKGGWIDEATREVHVKFFTFNANLGIFLRVILMIEINPAGVWRTRVESLVFEEIDVWRIVMEAVVLAFVVFYIVMLFREIIAYILRTKSLILWVFSVWRVIEIANLAIFLVVFYYKVNYWAFPHHELRLGEDTPDEIKNHPNAKDPNWYDSLVFMRLDNTMANLKVVSNLSAFNGVLVYLKLIKFFRTSPRLMILSETIKDALSSLIAILVYLLLVTQAYAMMGVSIWGTKLKDMRTLPEAWTYLLLSLLGDFDFNELADLEPFYAYLFFVTYQVLVWLVILNIVIGIVTSSYEKARAWQKRISGDTPVGPYMRNWIAQTETLIKDRLGFKRAKNIYIRKVTLYLRTRHRRASRKVDGYLGDDAMPILDDHTSTTVSRNVFAEQETRISDLIRNLAERSDHHITQEKPVFLLHITWDDTDPRTNCTNKVSHTFTTGVDDRLIFPPKTNEIYPKVISSGWLEAQGMKISVDEVLGALRVVKQDPKKRKQFIAQAKAQTAQQGPPVDKYPWVREDAIAVALLSECPSVKKYFSDYGKALEVATDLAKQLCFLVSPQQLQRRATYSSLISYWKMQEYAELMDEQIHMKSHVGEMKGLQKPWANRIFVEDTTKNEPAVQKSVSPRAVQVTKGADDGRNNKEVLTSLAKMEEKIEGLGKSFDNVADNMQAQTTRTLPDALSPSAQTFPTHSITTPDNDHYDNNMGYEHTASLADFHSAPPSSSSEVDAFTPPWNFSNSRAYM